MHPQLEKELSLVQTVYGQNALKTRYVHFGETIRSRVQKKVHVLFPLLA